MNFFKVFNSIFTLGKINFSDSWSFFYKLRISGMKTFAFILSISSIVGIYIQHISFQWWPKFERNIVKKNLKPPVEGSNLNRARNKNYVVNNDSPYHSILCKNYCKLNFLHSIPPSIISPFENFSSVQLYNFTPR